LPVEAPTLAEETNPFSTGFPDKSTATNRRMYAPGYATLAAFLGGPAAGIFLLALNYRALGRTAAAWGTAVAGGAVLAGLVAFILATPQHPSGICISLPALMMIYVLARGLQGEVYDQHVLRGGRQGSAWIAVLLGGLVLALTVGLVVGGGYFFPGTGMGERLDFGGGAEVYFDKGVMETEARQLGLFLVREGVFDGQHPFTVWVRKRDQRYLVSFCLQPGAWNQPEVIQTFSDLKPLLAQEVFPDKLMEIHLCDEKMVSKRTF
jgi:hypothetical protein